MIILNDSTVVFILVDFIAVFNLDFIIDASAGVNPALMDLNDLLDVFIDFTEVLISSVMFAFERFKLNKQIDQVSKQLDEENSRLDMIQQLLNVGYVEFDVATGVLYRSTNAIRMIGGDLSKKVVNQLDLAIGEAEDVESLKKQVAQILANPSSSGSICYRRKNDPNNYELLYNGKGDKIYAVVRVV